MMTGIFSSIEFYVIMVFLAAAVVGLAAMPSRRGAARTFLYAGCLYDNAPMSEPGIVAVVEADGTLSLYRFGLEGVGMDGAFSLALTIIGFDITIEERLTAGPASAQRATMARVSIDCLGAERYHFNFRSEATGRSAAFSLNIQPGNRIERRLN